MAKVTVLTAVYNAEKYLRECLNSLKNQTLADCQFICIDDCSTDASAEIIKEYALSDSRFHLLRTPVNSGQAVARNLGLQFATGEYIAMLDADDWFAPDTLEQAYSTLKTTHAQCAVLQLVQHYEDSGKEELYPIKSTKTAWSGEEAFRLSLDWSLHGLYVVEADIHKRFPFDTSCRLYSDDNTSRLHYLNSPKVVLCQGKYYYRKHSASLTTACTIRRFDHLLANLSMKEQLENLSLPQKQEILNFYERHRWFNFLGLYAYYRQHKANFTPNEHRHIEKIFSDVLSTIEANRLPLSLKLRPGYYPFHNYSTFSFVENLYFSLRNAIKSII
ncbi:MAG: glycosyltransferase family 2 protein [Prevotellaceae bacterium]|nr:glycosyltransferase family 2 protein [Prevotellaceae bacterium]